MIDIIHDRTHAPRFLAYLRREALNNRDRKCERERLQSVIECYHLEQEGMQPDDGQCARIMNGFINAQLLSHVRLGRKPSGDDFFSLTERGVELANEGEQLLEPRPQTAAPDVVPAPPPAPQPAPVAAIVELAPPAPEPPPVAVSEPVLAQPEPEREPDVAVEDTGTPGDASGPPTRRAVRYLAAVLPALDADGTCTFEVASTVSRSILELERIETGDTTPISVPQVSSTVGRMVRDGYFTKEPTAFGKGVSRYRITDRGRRIAEQAPPPDIEQVRLPFVPEPAAVTPQVSTHVPDAPSRTEATGAALALLLAESRLEMLVATLAQYTSQRDLAEANCAQARTAVERLRAVVHGSPAARITYESASRCVVAAAQASEGTPQ